MKTLLLIIDMQEGFRYVQSELVVPKIKELAENFKGTVAFSCFRNTKGSFFERMLKWKKFQNKHDQKIFRELHKPKKIFFHDNYTIINKDLLNFIKKEKFNSVYICGIYTDVCIIKAAMDLFDNKIRVKVIADACASLHGKNNHKYSLDTMRHVIGSENIVKTKNVIL